MVYRLWPRSFKGGPFGKALPRPGTDSLIVAQALERIDSGLVNRGPTEPGSAVSYSFTHRPFAFDDLTAASTKARPLTPSSMVGKWTGFGAALPSRAALMASATSE